MIIQEKKTQVKVTVYLRSQEEQTNNRQYQTVMLKVYIEIGMNEFFWFPPVCAGYKEKQNVAFVST